MLVAATLEGNPDAFGKLVDKYERPLFNLALRITGSRADAMDATQSAFLKAYEHLHRYDPRHRFFSWLYRIAVNSSIDQANRRREVELPEEVPEPAVEPGSHLESRETSRQVQRALSRLSGEQRTVVVLRHYLGLTYDEMGTVLEIPVKTVRSRLYEARQRLRRLLAEAGVER